MRVLDTAEMVAYERWAMEEVGLPGLVLMENAASGVTSALLKAFPAARSAVVLAGPGNNGGDGLAVARQLDAVGWKVELLVVGEEAALSSSTAVQLAACRALGLTPCQATPAALRSILRTGSVGAPDVMVDALLGTGLNRALEGVYAELVAVMGESAVPVVAVDVPTGLDASSHRILGACARAQLTVTFAALKVPHVLAPACSACGEVVVAGLGLEPPGAPRRGEAGLWLQDLESVRRLLRGRPADAHKGSMGHLLLVAGSPGMAGAAVLGARSAVRTGAGLVTVMVPEEIRGEVDVASLESMTLGLESDVGGVLGPRHAPLIVSASAERDAVALGPGLGRGPELEELLRQLLEMVACPLVLDAEGLNALGGDLAVLKTRRAATVLTPHPGELSRLLACSVSEIQEDRLAAVREAARIGECVVLLKGHQTLVAEARGGEVVDVWVNTTGNAGMATGGSGDVLTGMIGALLAQGHDASSAARLAAYLHGASGDLAAAELGQEALAAGDIVDRLGRAHLALEARE